MADPESLPGPDPSVQPLAGAKGAPIRLSPGVLREAGRRRRNAAESRERLLLNVALVSWVVPFGFILAAWPLTSAKGLACKLALISIPFNIVGWVYIVLSIVFRDFPKC